MKTRSSVRSRVKYEIMVICILVLVLASVLLLRDGGEPEAAAPTATPAQPTFSPEPSPIPPDMFEWREGEYVHVERGTKTSTLIDESRFTDLSKKTAEDLVNWAEMAWENQWGYVWGTYGNILNEDLLTEKLNQFGDDVADYEDIIRAQWMGRRVADCAGLIKGYGWYDPSVHNVVYNSGEMPDVGTDGFYDQAPDKGPIDEIPETPGLLVYKEGHIGVYVGGGWAIESISHAGGVVKTRVADRTWTHWLQCPTIEY